MGRASVEQVSKNLDRVGTKIKSPHISPPKQVVSKKHKGSMTKPTSLIKRVKDNPRNRKQTSKAAAITFPVIDIESITMKKEVKEKISNWKKGGLWPYVQEKEKTLLLEFMTYGWTSLKVWNKDKEHCLKAKDLDELMMNRDVTRKS